MPIEMVRGRKPYLGHFQKFGCKAIVHKSAEKRDRNFDLRYDLMMLVGYCKRNACKRNSVVVGTNHVTFNEGSFAK